MREIKFRAWDLITGKMIDWGDLLKKHNLNEIVEYGYDLKLMQYTGLKDKNGKEICEGDVVKFTRNVGPIYKPTIASDVGVIKWIEERASFRLCYNTQEQKIHSSYSSKYEVIGNIHENPELVEAKNE